MGLYDYELSRQLEAQDVPFRALIMAAMRRADTDNLRALRAAWPDVWDELAALATEIAPLLQEMHAGLQAKIDERGALYGPGTLPSALQLAALATMWR